MARMTAKQAAAPRTDPVQPYTTATAIPASAQLRMNTASTCEFHAVGTTCSR